MSSALPVVAAVLNIAGAMTGNPYLMAAAFVVSPCGGGSCDGSRAPRIVVTGLEDAIGPAEVETP